MNIHKEGKGTLFIVLVALTILNAAIMYFLPEQRIIQGILLTVSVAFYGFILQFFRNPTIQKVRNTNQIIAPADGKVVVIEETEENEYFKDKRIQISIFMSPLNVHVNRNPIDGIVKYFKYHPGKFLVAWHPKSSTDNERTTIVTEHPQNGHEILFRQIAGAVARRIVWYVDKGSKVNQSDEFGFIKFGSRVDVFLPLGTEINVNIDDKTKGGRTVLATFKD